MSTVGGLPAHVLLAHFMMVLAPVIASLVAVCGVWPAARRQLVRPTVALATVVSVLTPLTTKAGEWLEDHVDRSAAVDVQTELGDTMVYCAAVLFIATLALVTAVVMVVQVYRVGGSGSRAAWGDVAAHSDAAPRTRQPHVDDEYSYTAGRYDLVGRGVRP
ncbi:hypothetical protein GSM98_10140 [Rhodococcus rhodochrous]|uniref:hypothetical protein n=1 Tax=Rhodococcus rhodochrous TaxID=1829 RepID=UPI00132BFF80|nr:hypothetical protein [Rhodococcus rhodochrous]